MGQPIVGHAKQWFNVETPLIMLIQHAPCFNRRFQINIDVLTGWLAIMPKMSLKAADGLSTVTHHIWLTKNLKPQTAESRTSHLQNRQHVISWFDSRTSSGVRVKVMGSAGGPGEEAFNTSLSDCVDRFEHPA